MELLISLVFGPIASIIINRILASEPMCYAGRVFRNFPFWLIFCTRDKHNFTGIARGRRVCYRCGYDYVSRFREFIPH